MSRESLVILGKGVPVSSIEALVRVRQRFGDRVLYVDADDATRLSTMGGVTVIGADAQAATPDDGLTETEQMGIAAWNARDAIAKKKRPGEGLSWDAPGFEPP